MDSEAETSDMRRKRLLWRATHRGIKEMDLILGGFARANIEAMGEAELAALEAIIEVPDQQLLAWATHQAPVPEAQRTPLLLDMFAFRP